MKKIISIFIILFILLFSSQIIAKKKTPTTSKNSGPEYIFYPPLPNEPKYQFLVSFSTSKDIEKKKSKFLKFVAGKDEDKPREIKKAYGVDMCDGIIYVTDITNGTIVTFNLKTNEYGLIGMSGPGKLAKPINLTIDKQNKCFYVADMGRKMVLSFDLEGKFLQAYGEENQFEPADVDFFEDKLYVCDVKGHQIHVLDKKTGKTIFKIGKPGSKIGELFHPTNICIKDKRLYVSETNNFRVQIFDLDGNYIANFGQIGDRPGSFSRNKGVAVDNDGRIYVVDAAFENVQIFNKTFELLLFMFGPGVDKGNINLPAGIAIDYDDINYFKKYLSPNFTPEYLILVTSNFGRNKVNVYAFGSYKK